MTTHDFVRAGFDVAPPVTVAALHIGGVALPDGVAFLAGIYTLMRIADLAWKWRERARGRRQVETESESDTEE